MADRTITLTIPVSGTQSNAEELGGGVDMVTLYAPATLPETVTLHSSPDGVTFSAHQVTGADVTLAAGKARSVYPLRAHSIKLVAGAAVAAQRVATAYLAGV